MGRGDLAHLAVSGACFAVRATPRAAQARVSLTPEGLRIAVTEPAENGKANAAVTEALARALGVARTRLTLLRGATARDKLFRLD